MTQQYVSVLDLVPNSIRHNNVLLMHECFTNHVVHVAPHIHVLLRNRQPEISPHSSIHSHMICSVAIDYENDYVFMSPSSK